MRIAAVTRLTGFTLILVCAALACLGYLGIARLDEPYRLTSDYYDLKDDLSVRIRGLIDAYLATGDAMRLQEAGNAMGSLIEQRLSLLPEETAAGIRPHAEALRQALDTDLRASGKLSGDSQGLLLNAERELAAALARLGAYAREGYAGHAALAFQYADKGQQLALAVQRLAHQRQHYFDTGKDSNRDALLAAQAEIQTLVTELDSLPRLGVMTKADQGEDDLVGGGSSGSRWRKARKSSGTWPLWPSAIPWSSSVPSPSARPLPPAARKSRLCWAVCRNKSPLGATPCTACTTPFKPAFNGGWRHL
ncbi:hypothetical protein [Methylogaea oryzae]|uniref:hypothetical protein n=1 Tax=Methylogaea oryzae TaxID=1295382 RepID=UPI00156B360E|nr:hypothetical protein [Methylogaea oryzae]